MNHPHTLCSDPVALGLWHPIAALEDSASGVRLTTRLLGERIHYTKLDDQQVSVEHGDRSLPVTLAYGYIWTCMGTPTTPLFDLPEYAESDRRNVCAATVGVKTSAPRAVENFLDMGHFPFVHTGILGTEPHTEVREYEVTLDEKRDEILATECIFYQPQAAAGATGGIMADYIYRVPHPYCSVLYKSCPTDESRLDVIALFLQPVDEETIRAHALVSVIDAQSSDLDIRMFQQTIFGQDKPILENQLPKRLPLDPRAETPIRADKAAIVYRRWLRSKGLNYGVIPAAA
ncbi:aromatic ring-hydroxylating oxygenase subunit alpha [Granulosicoccus antarcticus]|uniref:Putative methylxanthine N7-demethylase NdmC n=1 Tax=Granulosicoccus antarcticus IMCC3135 TaxID=1192854 RepID=A0A2Z2NZB2_9GAMM|nr:aromatic ring-hydroxylating dioxygenase subunit alpha [Granulosicoccus antarcticus]ASJ76786.1 putative methylxanthine N7-demethylase NdmC [Granulosicoccus antarcticus IMCC3135]